MAEEQSSVNPWVRADLERFNPETLALIPTGMQPEYERVMKELAHYKAIFGLVTERLQQCEAERADFFHRLIGDAIKPPEPPKIDTLTPLGRKILNEVREREVA